MSKLTDKGTLTTSHNNDWIHTVDVSDLSSSPQGTSKKITRHNFLKSYVGFDSRYKTLEQLNEIFVGITTQTGYNKGNWDSAYNWGNHATEGYLKTETHASAGYEIIASKGIADGYAPLNSNGKVDNAFLPDFGNTSIEEFANLAALPAAGDVDVLYVTLDDNQLYRWTGSQYVGVGGSNSVSWGDVTGRPSTFIPAYHTQDWDSITGKPLTFAPSVHNHHTDAYLHKRIDIGVTTQDWNTLLDNGAYRVSNATGANRALGYRYGVLIVDISNGYINQSYYPNTQEGVYTRSKFSSNAWTPWSKLLSNTGNQNIINGGVISDDGFYNTAYHTGYNRIWAFRNSDAYGMAYYQGVGGGDHIGFHFGDKNAPKFKFNISGVLYASNFALTSDRSKKTDIKPIKENFKIDWKSFKMKDNLQEKRYGIIADELHENHPEFVDGKQGSYSVKYIDLLCAAMANKDKQIEDLQKQIDDLKELIHGSTK